MSARICVCALIIAVVLSGCQSGNGKNKPDTREIDRKALTTISVIDQDAVLPRRGTFKLVSMQELSTQPDYKRTSLGLAGAAIVLYMNDRNYQLRESGQADLLVAYALAQGEVISDAELNARMGVTAPGNKKAISRYDEGSLIIHIFDGKSGARLWRGAVNAHISNNKEEPGSQLHLRLRVAAGVLLDKFFPGHYL